MCVGFDVSKTEATERHFDGYSICSGASVVSVVIAYGSGHFWWFILHIMRIAFVCTDVRYWPQLPSNARVAYIRRVHQQSFCLSAHFGWATLSALHLIIVCMRERYIFRDATLSPAIWRLVEIGYWFTAHVFSSVCSFFQYVCSLRPKAPHKMKRGNWNSIRADK